MENNSTYSYKQMQDMLPDYVFNRISLEEKALFENTLPLYPDLQDEVNDVRDVFSKVDSMDLESEISDKTRNLSIRVKNKMNKKSAKMGSPFLTRYVLPVFSLFVIGFFVFNTFIFTPDDPTNGPVAVQNIKTEEPLVSETELAVIFSDAGEDEIITETLYYDLGLVDAPEESLIETANASNTDEFFNDLKIDSKTIDVHKTLNYNQLLEQLNDMDETEFQNMLKELEDVKIFS